jgi:hypothetical protein
MPNRYTGQVQEEKGGKIYDSYRDEKGREWLYDPETNQSHRSKKDLEADKQRAARQREAQTTDSNNK